MHVSMSYPGVNQAEYGIHIRVVAPQKYVNIYSTRRAVLLAKPASGVDEQCTRDPQCIKIFS